MTPRIHTPLPYAFLKKVNGANFLGRGFRCGKLHEGFGIRGLVSEEIQRSDIREVLKGPRIFLVRVTPAMRSEDFFFISPTVLWVPATCSRS